MNRLMCRFVATTKEKIPDRKLDMVCPAGIPCNKLMCRFEATMEKKIASPILDTVCPQGIPRNKLREFQELFRGELFFWISQ